MSGEEVAELVLFTPVRQDVDVLAVALESWRALTLPLGTSLNFWFHDDNDDPRSQTMLADFVAEAPGREIVSRSRDFPRAEDDVYSRAGATHVWSNPAIQRVARIKDAAIDRFLGGEATHLLLIDSDIVVHPATLERLLSRDRDVVAQLFWTRFLPEAPLMPNAWDVHPSRFVSAASLQRLREVGTYEVGGLGACTLLSRHALELGSRFALLPSVDLWGEDRHFCVRASALGLRLYLDTAHPAFHVYTADLVDRAAAWLADGCDDGFWRDQLDDTWMRQTEEWVRRQHGVRARGLRKLTRLPARLRAEWSNQVEGHSR